jgi:hypothetical protein
MLSFDAPMRESCVVRRSRTNTPLQALVTLNETAFVESARAMAYRLLREETSDDARLNKAYELALGRPPTPREQTLLLRALDRYRKRYAGDADGARKLLQIGDLPTDDALPLTERAAWMLLCSTLMNTDEFLTQQ